MTPVRCAIEGFWIMLMTQSPAKWGCSEKMVINEGDESTGTMILNFSELWENKLLFVSQEGKIKKKNVL